MAPEGCVRHKLASTTSVRRHFPQIYDPLGRFLFVGLTADF